MNRIAVFLETAKAGAFGVGHVEADQKDAAGDARRETLMNRRQLPAAGDEAHPNRPARG